jgi:hypothetical protein
MRDVRNIETGSTCTKTVFSFSFDGGGYRTIEAKEMSNFVRKQIKNVTTLDYEALLAND